MRSTVDIYEQHGILAAASAKSSPYDPILYMVAF
jgi:hypothetical protein